MYLHQAIASINVRELVAVFQYCRIQDSSHLKIKSVGFQCTTGMKMTNVVMQILLLLGFVGFAFGMKVEWDYEEESIPPKVFESFLQIKRDTNMKPIQYTKSPDAVRILRHGKIHEIPNAWAVETVRFAEVGQYQLSYHSCFVIELNDQINPTQFKATPVGQGNYFIVELKCKLNEMLSIATGNNSCNWNPGNETVGSTEVLDQLKTDQRWKPFNIVGIKLLDDYELGNIKGHIYMVWQEPNKPVSSLASLTPHDPVKFHPFIAVLIDRRSGPPIIRIEEYSSLSDEAISALTITPKFPPPSLS